MKKLLYAIMLFSLCLACTDRQTARRLDRAQSLADSLPAEARGILDSLRPQLSGLSRSQLMRYHLTRIQADNLLDSTLHEDSLMRQVAEYYDDHGTANERMLAYYLLGRTYSDMGEAPQALQAFHDAIDHADTTSSDCDYRRLSRIYGQMAGLFVFQNMYREQINALKYMSDYALKAQDTITSLIALQGQADGYFLLNKRDSVIYCCQKASSEFSKMGRKDLAAQSLGLLLDTYIERHEVQKAEAAIKRYEEDSGLFDSLGNICASKEIFYYYKGKLYIEKRLYDSAEYYFQKELCQAKDVENTHAAFHGLSLLYKSWNRLDSLAKYALLSEQYNDSLYSQTNTQTLQQINNLYKYDRFRDLANKKTVIAERNKRHLIILTVIFVTLVFISGLILLNEKSKRKRTREQYEHDMKVLELEQESLYYISKKDYEGFEQRVNEKNDIIRNLQHRIASYQSNLHKKSRVDLERKLVESRICNVFKGHLKNLTNPSIEDWRSLRLLINQEYPNFYTELNKDNLLSLTEYEICILIRLRFSPSEISVLMNFDRSNISVIRKRMFKKLFKKEGSTKQFDQFLFNISQ